MLYNVDQCSNVHCWAMRWKSESIFTADRDDRDRATTAGLENRRTDSIDDHTLIW